MRVLLLYTAVGEAIDNFHRAIVIGERLLPQYLHYNRVLTTDMETPAACDFPVLRTDNLWEEGLFNKSRALNVGLDYAQQTNMDAVVMLDADGVLLTPILNPPPFAKTLTYMASETETEPGEGPWHFMNLIVLRKGLLSYRYCEYYAGWGAEDHDFRYCILNSAGYWAEDVGYKTMHLGHPPRIAGWNHGEGTNRVLYCNRVVQFMKQRGMPLPVESFFEGEEAWVRERLKEA